MWSENASITSKLFPHILACFYVTFFLSSYWNYCVVLHSLILEKVCAMGGGFLVVYLFFLSDSLFSPSLSALEVVSVLFEGGGECVWILPSLPGF